ncbi:MAG: signal peptidase II [Pseudomonadota bacterium]
MSIAVFIFVLDQIHKYWMLYIFWPQQGCDPFHDGRLSATCHYKVSYFLDLLMIWNRGISYGLFQQHSLWGQLFLIGIAVIAAIFLFIWLSQINSILMCCSLGLVIGGALGNAVDRYIYGAVADFFSLHVNGFYWYVFNIADVAIVAGVLGLLYNSIFENRKKVSKTL